jgi:hypothetical protein
MDVKKQFTLYTKCLAFPHIAFFASTPLTYVPYKYLLLLQMVHVLASRLKLSVLHRQLWIVLLTMHRNGLHLEGPLSNCKVFR